MTVLLPLKENYYIKDPLVCWILFQMPKMQIPQQGLQK